MRYGKGRTFDELAEIAAARFRRIEALEAENERLWEALGAYRSALLSGEMETDQMRTLLPARPTPGRGE